MFRGSDELNLFVIATSGVRRGMWSRSVRRKVYERPLESFDPQEQSAFLARFASDIPENVREEIKAWTGGYPLGLQVLSRLVTDSGLDPTRPADRKELLPLFTDAVIDRTLLVKLPIEEQPRMRTLLGLWSLPRRFNFLLGHDLIERFAPEYKLDNIFAYSLIPKYFASVMPAGLGWDYEKSGFSVNEVLRPTLSLDTA